MDGALVRMVENPAARVAGQETVARAHADAQALADPDGSPRRSMGQARWDSVPHLRYDRILKVARTIADLAGADPILSDPVIEAVQYHSLDRQIWT